MGKPGPRSEVVRVLPGLGGALEQGAARRGRQDADRLVRLPSREHRPTRLTRDLSLDHPSAHPCGCAHALHCHPVPGGLTLSSLGEDRLSARKGQGFFLSGRTWGGPGTSESLPAFVTWPMTTEVPAYLTHLCEKCRSLSGRECGYQFS